MSIKDTKKDILVKTEDELLKTFVRKSSNVGEKLPPKRTLSRRNVHETKQVEDDRESSSAADAKEYFDYIKNRIEKKIKKRNKYAEELYTDKDRAAAVMMGSKDIKQSLKQKKKQERSRFFHIPMQANAGTLLAFGRNEFKAGRVQKALEFINKAMELSPKDKQNFIERSKCHLMLGDPKAALEDAESALKIDENCIKAIFQKAEALYFSGDFEHSLMFYHRGIKMRPDLEEFRLGVQKAQDAIESTIGATKLRNKKQKKVRPIKSAVVERPKSVVSQIKTDKQFLENLLKNPDLSIGEKKNEAIVKQAEEALNFLKNREKFWKQQTK